MTKVRIYVFLSTLLIVGVFGVFVSFYARGYRLNLKTFKFDPNGILVIKSEPDGASVYVNKELKGATNTSLSLAPGNYDVEVKKDGFFPWSKRLSIDKEIVTNVSISLFKNVPSLSPITFSGAINPAVSQDGTKMAFLVPTSKDPGNDKEGLWSLDTFNFPLGFSGDPKMITDGDLTGSTYVFSPDARQILLTTSNGIFLLDSGSFISQSQRINIASRVPSILAQWENEKKIKNESLVRNLPPDVADILTRKSKTFTFSPDETMILYTASSSGTLPEDLISQLPGSSTQKQERNVNAGSSYVYDIKEDRNFLITNNEVVVGDTPNYSLRWMPSSKHILLAQPDQVIIMDYDGTNRQVVYSGSYFAPFAFPYRNSTKLLILTNLGAISLVPNLYTLTIK